MEIEGFTMSEDIRLVIIVCAMCFVSFMIGLVSGHIIWGQEPDYRYSCQFTEQFAFRDDCAKKQMEIKYLVLLKIAACENDEAICVLGHPDPDNDDDGEDP